VEPDEEIRRANDCCGTIDMDSNIGIEFIRFYKEFLGTCFLKRPLPLHRYSARVVLVGPEFAPHFCVRLDPRIVFAGQSFRRRLKSAIVHVYPKISVAPFVSGMTRLLCSPDAWTIRVNPCTSAIVRVCTKLGQVFRIYFMYYATVTATCFVPRRGRVFSCVSLSHTRCILIFLLRSSNLPGRVVSLPSTSRRCIDTVRVIDPL